MFYSVQYNSVDEIEIKKSKFITYLFCVSTKEEIDAHLSRIRGEHKKATHVTYAYRLLSPSAEKASDDGEPSGTAGVPILDVLKKRGLNNILAVVVRYFGGIKLGAGGLIRAYAGSVVEALEGQKIIAMDMVKKYRLTCPIKDYKKYVLSLQNSCQKVDVNFGENVTILLYTNEEQSRMEVKIGKTPEYVGDTICEVSDLE